MSKPGLVLADFDASVERACIKVLAPLWALWSFLYRAKITLAVGSFIAYGFLALFLKFPLDVALEGAADGHSLLCARVFCLLGADPNELDNGTTPLGEAIEPGDTEKVSILLEVGADPNVRDHPDYFFSSPPHDDIGRTVLGEAVYGHDEAIVRLLLEHGADPNAADKDGTTPLMTARKKHFTDTIALLKQFGAR